MKVVMVKRRTVAALRARAKRSTDSVQEQFRSLQERLPELDRNSSLPFSHLLTVVRQYARTSDRSGRIDTMSKKITKKAAKKVAKKAGKKAAAQAAESASLTRKKTEKVQKKATKAALDFAKKGKNKKAVKAATKTAEKTAQKLVKKAAKKAEKKAAAKAEKKVARKTAKKASKAAKSVSLPPVGTETPTVTVSAKEKTAAAPSSIAATS